MADYDDYELDDDARSRGETDHSSGEPDGEADPLDTEPTPGDLAEAFLLKLAGNREEAEKSRAAIEKQIANVLAGKPVDQSEVPLSALEQLADKMTTASAAVELRQMLSDAAATRAEAIRARDALEHVDGSATLEPPVDYSALDGAVFDRLLRELTGHVDLAASAPAGYTADSWRKLVTGR